MSRNSGQFSVFSLLCATSRGASSNCNHFGAAGLLVRHKWRCFPSTPSPYIAMRTTLEKQVEKQIDVQIDEQTKRQTDRHTDEQTNAETTEVPMLK